MYILIKGHIKLSAYKPEEVHKVSNIIYLSVNYML